MAVLYDVDALQKNNSSQPKGTFIKGPIKDVYRAIAKIYRTYDGDVRRTGDVRRITDIVRCCVVLDALVDIDHFLKILDATFWVD